MVARARTEGGALTVALFVDGLEPDEMSARDPTHAAAVAITLIATRGQLYAGDVLIVRRDTDPPDSLPEASRASHQSS